MKKYLFLIFALLFLVFSSNAQEKTNDKIHSFSIFCYPIPSLAYHQTWDNGSKNLWGWRVGVGFVPKESNVLSNNERLSKTYWSPFYQLSFYRLHGKQRSFFETGIMYSGGYTEEYKYLPNSGNMILRMANNYEIQTIFDHSLNVRLGYRLQPRKGGFFLNTTFFVGLKQTLRYNKPEEWSLSFSFIPELSIGYSFRHIKQ